MTTHTVESEGYALARKMTDGEDDEASVGKGDPRVFTITYSFGPPEKDYLLKSLLERTIHQQEFMDQFYPDVEAGNLPADSVVVNPFRLVNGIPFKMVYGRDDRTDNEYVANETRIYKPINPNLGGYVRKQRYNLWESLGTFDHEVYGTIMHDVTLNIQRGGKITCALVGKGCQNEGAAFAQDPVTPVYPSDVKQPYRLIDALSWGFEDIGKWVSVNFMGRQNIEGMMGKNGHYEHLDEQFPIVSGIVIFAADVPDSIWTDFWDKNKKTAFLRITKGNQDTITGASEAITDVTNKEVTMTAITGTVNEFAGDYLKMTDGSFKRKWYKIASNTDADPVILTLENTPDNINGDNAYITDDTTKFIDFEMPNALIAQIESTKTEFKQIVFAITIVGADIKIRCKDNVADVHVDEQNE